MNKRSDIINYLLNEDNNNKAKNEEYIKKTCERWKNIEQQIKDQKTIKIPKHNRELLIKYLNNENNKNKLLRIFDKEILNSFIEASTCIDKSRELLNNPETKKEEIKSIEDYLLKGVDNVKVTNMLLEKTEREKIINYMYAKKKEKYKEKSEVSIKSIENTWSTFEKIIKDKKLNKIRLYDKHIIYDFYKDNGDKSTIFDSDCFQSFKEDYEDKSKIKKPAVSL